CRPSRSGDRWPMPGCSPTTPGYRCSPMGCTDADGRLRIGVKPVGHGGWMDEASRTVPRPVLWLLAVLVGLLLALTVSLVGLRMGHRHGGAAGLSSAEQAAVNAAKQETINIQTYRLKSFD